MSFRLLSRWLGRGSAAPTALPARPRARLGVEGFEDRIVPAAPVDLSPALAAPAAGAASLLPISITDVVNQNGVLTAIGRVGNAAFTAPVNLSLGDAAAGAVPILNLELGAISLDLLGLKVDTSDICLAITAEPGAGNLLGNLLGGLAGALDGGLSLGDALGDLTDRQQARLLGGIESLLNGVLSQATAATAVSGVSGTAAGTTDILNLSLGPVDLDLLGLQVSLDDCDGGPVTVDVTAEAGPGNLLGNLLTGLAGALDDDNQRAIDRFLDRIGDQIDRLLDRAGGVVDTGLGAIDRLLDRAGELLDAGNLAAVDRVLDRIGDRVDRLLDRGVLDDDTADAVNDLLDRAERLLDRGNVDAVDRLLERIDRVLDQAGTGAGDALGAVTRLIDRVGDLIDAGNLAGAERVLDRIGDRVDRLLDRGLLSPGDARAIDRLLDRAADLIDAGRIAGVERILDRIGDILDGNGNGNGGGDDDDDEDDDDDDDDDDRGGRGGRGGDDD